MKQLVDSLPDTPYARRGDSGTAADALEQVTRPLQALASELAGLVSAHGLREAVITIDGPEGAAGSVTLSGAKNGHVSVRVSGSAGVGDTPAGTPYYANYSGEFFWRPTPDSAPFVHSGDRVKSGQLVAWAMGESKGMSFGLRASEDGVITLAAPNASKVREGETLLFYIENVS